MAQAEVFPVVRRFTLASEMGPMLDGVLAEAVAPLCVFDRDLSEGGWDSPTRESILRTFLHRSGEDALRIVLRDVEWVAGHAPRLMSLLADYPTRMRILRTLPEASRLTDAFVIAGPDRYWRRYHQDHTRGEWVKCDPEGSRTLANRFEEIVQAAEPGLSGTVLGL